MARKYAEKDIKLLFAQSGGYCAFPACTARLVEPANAHDPAAVLGQICHMVASSDDGPRGSKDFPEDLRDKYDNLILLCNHHHTLIDKQPNTYTVEDLKEWKSNREEFVTVKLTSGMRSINFAELEVVCKHLISGNSGIDSSPLRAVDIQSKMDANNLSGQTSYRMTIGLMQAHQVADFLSKYSSMFDRDFPRKLREGFVKMYNRHYYAGLRGDNLFIAIAQEAGSVAPPDDAPDRRWSYEAASLAVLCHLFELCEVFEAA